jgi:hypothetical protein
MTSIFSRLTPWRVASRSRMYTEGTMIRLAAELTRCSSDSKACRLGPRGNR